MAVSARLSELESAMLEALSLGRSQTDTIREGLRLLWEREGRGHLQALQVLKPDQANHLVALMQAYDGEDPAWFQAIWATLDANPPQAGRPKEKE